VAAFDMLRKMRMEEEGLSELDASDAVLRDNVYGLEIDPRCAQIAAFALALAAWKSGEYRRLPPLHVACSGIPVRGQLEEWSRLAGDDFRLKTSLERLHTLFRNAPELGSLIDPAGIPDSDRMFAAPVDQVLPLLAEAIVSAHVKIHEEAAIAGAAAEGAVQAANILARRYTVVATNVPFCRAQEHIPGHWDRYDRSRQMKAVVANGESMSLARKRTAIKEPYDRHRIWNLEMNSRHHKPGWN
jgi:hypothetical protein